MKKLNDMGILFLAPLSQPTSGYGKAALGILDVLNRMKKKKQIKYVREVDTGFVKFDLDEELMKMKFDAAIFVGYPPVFLENEDFNRRISLLLSRAERKYMSIVWETDRLPNEWKALWKNNIFDGFLAPSYFVIDLLKKVTDKPIFYYPHHVNVSDWLPIDVETKKNEKKFTALYLGQYTARKGIQDAVIAFSRALGEYQNTELIVKINKLSNKEINPTIYLRSLAQMNCLNQKARIHMIEEDIDDVDINELYKHSSVLLFPTRGEGFALPIPEAMSVGLPVIYTNWSACTQVANSPYNYPVDYYLDDAHSMTHFRYGIGLNYAVPKISSIIRCLNICYSKWSRDKENYYIEAKNNRSLVKERFGFDAVAKCIQNILENVEYVEREKIITKDVNKNMEVEQDELGFNWIIRNETNCDNVIQDKVSADIEHERFVLFKILQLLNKDYTFIDVGAHTGYYSIRVADKVSNVISFEPNSENTKGLLINKDLNSIDNLYILKIGLGSKKYSTYLSQKGASSTKNMGVLSDSIHTDITTLDYSLKLFTLKQEIFLKNLFIKIDTEGMELDVINGAKEVLKDHNCLVLVEYHDNIYETCKGDKEKIIKIMVDLNYRIKEEFIDYDILLFEKKLG